MAYELTDLDLHGDDMPVCEHTCAQCRQVFEHETSYKRWRDCAVDVPGLCCSCGIDGYFFNLDGKVERGVTTMTDLVALRKELGAFADRLHKIEREINDDACHATKGHVDAVYKGRAAMAIDSLIWSIGVARREIKVAYELPADED